jgi:DNA replication ATP-dependent helicase Dna2
MEVIEEEAIPVVEERRSPGSSDEFDDADFDADMVEALDISQQAVHPFVSDGNVQAREPTPAPPVLSQHEYAPPQPVVDTGSDDEFGLDDEQEFAADLEQVASLYDNRTEVASVEAQAVLKDYQELPADNVAPVINLDEDDSDEFGDDIDPDEFAAAEMQATQGYNTVCRAQANVY